MVAVLPNAVLMGEKKRFCFWIIACSSLAHLLLEVALAKNLQLFLSVNNSLGV